MRVKSNEAGDKELWLIKVVTRSRKPSLLPCLTYWNTGGVCGNKEVGPKIASLYSSLIRTHGFCGDLIAIIMPASVRALLPVCVCVSASSMAVHRDLWIRQILKANNGALCLRQDYSLDSCQLNKRLVTHTHTRTQKALPLLNLQFLSAFLYHQSPSVNKNILQLQNFGV